jgi:LPS export ABC transporter permease LptG
MKTLDRYISGLYATAFGVFILFFLLLYLLIDFVGRIQDIVNLAADESRLWFCVRFYAVRIPYFLTFLLPVVTLFAAMFTCHRLARSNELVPMIAAGISMRRVAAPFFAAGLVTAGVLAALEEWALPRLGALITQSENVLRRGDTESSVFVRDRRGDTFYFKLYRYSNFEVTTACVARFGPQRQIRELIVAARGACAEPPGPARPGAWVFFDGQITRYGENLDRTESVPLPPEGLRVETDLDPVDLTRAEKVAMSTQSIPRILELIRENPRNPVFPLRFHRRLSTPLGPLLLLLLGIPFVVRTERQNVFVGLGICLLVCGGYYVAQFVGVDGGVKGDLPPAAAAWLPAALFGTIGTWLFFRKLET